MNMGPWGGVLFCKISPYVACESLITYIKAQFQKKLGHCVKHK